ncbi:MAG: DUF2279 domain-containing protein [Salinivirgaceae bacterium]|jgi:hypothetical protein|nr:DUF2279 domain-containing protein [Salinivirgaceae bacterium]
MYRFRILLYALVTIFIFGTPVHAQHKEDSLQFTIQPTHLITAEAVSYAGAMLVLNEAWYKNYPRTRFHWFNDNNEWLQMDKAGHTYAAYQLSLQNGRLLQKTGLSEKKAVILSSGIALTIISSIELFDGFSKHWGASAGDLMANTTGVGLYLSQALAFNEQIVRLKYSYRPSPYATMAPDKLGGNLPERMLKDYNAQTYWLSVGLNRLTGIKAIPKWLAISGGYGAHGMVAGHKTDNAYPERYRQFLLSLDIDWQQINTKRKGLRVLLRALNMIKIPLPAVSYQQEKVVFHWYQ